MKENKPARPPVFAFGNLRCGMTHHTAYPCREAQVYEYIKYLEEKLEKIDRKKKQK